MYADIERRLQARSKMLCEGQFEELATLYSLPFVAYLNGAPTYIEDLAQAVKALRKVAAFMKCRGTVALNTEVSSVELPKNNRFRVWSRYSEINAAGDVTSQADVLQYLTKSPEGPLVQMIEFKSCEPTSA